MHAQGVVKHVTIIAVRQFSCDLAFSFTILIYNKSYRMFNFEWWLCAAKVFWFDTFKVAVQSTWLFILLSILWLLNDLSYMQRGHRQKTLQFSLILFLHTKALLMVFYFRNAMRWINLPFSARFISIKMELAFPMLRSLV